MDCVTMVWDGNILQIDTWKTRAASVFCNLCNQETAKPLEGTHHTPAKSPASLIENQHTSNSDHPASGGNVALPPLARMCKFIGPGSLGDLVGNHGAGIIMITSITVNA